MSWSIVTLREVPATRWKNGGGVTRELLAWPAPGDWQVRISVADVERDGPFSAFPGVERWFTVVEGPGVELRSEGRAKLVAAGAAPIRFDGGVAMQCALPAGPTRDLNLMAPPGRSTMRYLVPGDRVTPGAGIAALYTHQSGAILQWGDEEVELPQFSLAWRLLDAAARGQVVGGVGWWMEVRT